MEYYTVKEAATLWKVSDTMIRRYLRRGQIPGAFQEDGSWKIPSNTVKPGTFPKVEEENYELSPLLKRLYYQQKRNNHFGIYEYLQLNMAYSSNRMASNRLTRDQVETIYRAHRISPNFEPVKVDDVLEAINHFRALDFVLNTCMDALTPDYIKQLHVLLTYGTFLDRNNETSGIFRGKPTRISGQPVPSPAQILRMLRTLTLRYEQESADLQKILDFHVHLERIRPFDDYNGRLGRLIMLKECLRFGIDPFIIDDKRRGPYNRGIAAWDEDPSLLTETVLQAQKRFQTQMDTCNQFEYCRPVNPRKLL